LGGLPVTREEFKELANLRLIELGKSWWVAATGGDFGVNAFTDGLANSLNNKTIQDARGMFLEKRATSDGI